MAVKSLRILAQLDLPSGSLRFWDGSGGPFTDADGEIWQSCILTEDALAQIEMAINAEAFDLALVISGISEDVSNQIWADYQTGTIKGSLFRIFVQDCDERDQPSGAAQIKGTFRVDNLIFNDQASEDQVRSTITVEMANRFSMRRLTNGSVLSDVDQKERAKILNPSAPVDRFAERVILMRDKTVRWPNW